MKANPKLYSTIEETERYQEFKKALGLKDAQASASPKRKASPVPPQSDAPDEQRQ